VMAVLGSVDPSMKATLLAQGIAEASACRLLGTFLTSGLCAAAALALGLSAIANSTKPAPVGLLAVLAAAPVLVACLLVPNFRELGPVAFVVILPALAFVLAAGMGGLGVAGDARSAVLAATLGIPATLAVTALARGVGVAGMIHLFQAIAMVSPDDKAVIAAQGASELASADRLALIAAALGALGALGLAAFAFTRAVNKRAVLIEVGLCGLIAALAMGSDAAAVGAAGKAMSDASREPWADVPGFQPLHADGSEGGDVWVLTPDRLTSPKGENIDAPLSDAGRAKLTAALAALPDSNVRFDGPSQVHAWSVAVDRRVSADDFVKLVEVARGAKLDQLVVVGRAAEHADTGSSAAWWLGLLGTTGGQPFWLSKPPDYGDTKPLKLLSAQELTGLSDSRFHPALDPKQFTPQALLDAAAKLRRESRSNPLLVGPGGLDALAGSENEDWPPRTHDAKDVLSRNDDEDDADAKEPLGSGRDKDELVKVMSAHRGQMKYCYEKRLATNPKLEGKVVFQLVIGASGKVREVSVDSTTLNDSEAEACMLSRLKALTFPKKPGAGDVYVAYPFVFKAR